MNDDAAWMARALFVAERGRGRTTPHPLVGAVVVSPEGIVLGQGAHLVAGGPHAEVHALAAAGVAARVADEGAADVSADGVIKLSLGKKKHILVRPA